MCTGRRSAPTPQPAPQVAAPPPLKTPPPVHDIPSPEKIAEEGDDPNLITGKKKTKKKLEQIKKGVKEFDAIDPGMNPGTPPQGIPKVK